MKQFTRFAFALTLPLLAVSVSASPLAGQNRNLPDISKMRYQAKNYKTLFNSERAAGIDRLNKRMAAASGNKAPEPDFAMKGLDQFEYIDGPNGSVYLCSSEFETKEVQVDEYYKRADITAFKFKIYDSDYNLIGEIKDKVRLDTITNPENPEIRVASLGISPIITQKFFNSNNNFEVMVYFNMNTPNYSVNSRSVAYQLGGEKDEEGNDIPLCTINGNLCDVLEVKTDAWSENFYMTFASDYQFPIEPGDDSFSAYANSEGALIETYKKVSYASSAPEKFFEYKMRINDWPGDQENATPLISLSIDGKPYFIVNGYTDGLWRFEEPEDEYSFADQVWNDKTKYFVDIYQPVSLDNPNLIQHTEVDVVKSPGDKIFATFYFLGDLGYRDDINFEYCDEEGKANLLITTRDWDGAEMANTSSYYLYAPDGSRKATVGLNIDGVLAMSDIKGQEPEYMFILENDGQYTFEFVNPYNGSVHHTIDQVLPWNGDHESLYVNGDRIGDADSYKYCFELMRNGVDEEGNDLMRIAWINTAGEIESIDEVNMGKNITMAKVYLVQDVLSPYVYDTTPEREYMMIVKRANPATSLIQEELIISAAASRENPVGKILLELTPDKIMGVLNQISVIPTSAGSLLWVVYYNNNTNKYSQVFYNLPLSKFQGGDGSAENPYLIGTVGDLQCVRDNLAAHYEIINDFDAAGFNFATIGSSQTPFTGKINGNGHLISNLTVGGTNNYNAMFAYISQAAISDVTFINPTLIIDDASYNAFIASNMQSSVLKDVHAVGLTVNSETDGEFGGLVNKATGTSVIKGCSVTNASVNLPKASLVGGVVGETRTSSAITASAFSGKLVGKSNVGGILGVAGPNAGSIADCHVDADIEGENIVGGVVGDMDTRIHIDHCYVEGSLSASQPYGTRIVNKGFAVGGIAGNVSTYHANNEASSETQQSSANEVITNCLVNLESISTPELPEGHQSSVHRIAGFTSINDLEPDWDNIEDYHNIDKFLPTSVENGLKNNYAIASLPKVDPAIEAETSSTEGKDIEASELNEEFFAALGFKFGDTPETPWQEVSANDPALYHEIGSTFMADEITAEANTSFNAELIVVSRKPMTLESFMEGFSGEISDESVVEMNGDFSINNNVCAIGFDALKEGTAEFTANVNGSLSKVKFNILAASSIDEVAVDNSGSIEISFNGVYAISKGATLKVYSLDGKEVAAGNGIVSLASLAEGFYVVTAADNAGNKTARKFLLR